MRLAREPRQQVGSSLSSRLVGFLLLSGSGDPLDLRRGFRFFGKDDSACDDTEDRRALGPPSKVHSLFSVVHREQGILLSHWHEGMSQWCRKQHTLTLRILSLASLRRSGRHAPASIACSQVANTTAVWCAGPMNP